MTSKVDKIIDIMKQPLDIYTCELQAVGYLEDISAEDFAEVYKRVCAFERDLHDLLKEDEENDN